MARRSQKSHEAKRHALAGRAVPVHPENIPAYDPGRSFRGSVTMVWRRCRCSVEAAVLISDSTGRLRSRRVVRHPLEPAGQTLAANRPGWTVRPAPGTSPMHPNSLRRSVTSPVSHGRAG
jgi:hypothetical protein